MMKHNLPRRQEEIMTMIVKGANSTEICERLGIANNTFLNHRKRMFRKLGINSSCQLAGLAMVNGWVPMRPLKTEKTQSVSYAAKRVLVLVSQGKRNAEIEALLGIRVRPYLDELYEKLETSDRIRIVTRGFRAGLWTVADFPPVWLVAA